MLIDKTCKNILENHKLCVGEKKPVMPSILLNIKLSAKLSLNTLASVGFFLEKQNSNNAQRSYDRVAADDQQSDFELRVNKIIFGGGTDHISLLSLFPSGSCSTKGQWTAHIPPTAICHRLPSPPATRSAATEWTFRNNILPPSASRGPTAALTFKVLLFPTKIE